MQSTSTHNLLSVIRKWSEQDGLKPANVFTKSSTFNNNLAAAIVVLCMKFLLSIVC